MMSIAGDVRQPSAATSQLMESIVRAELIRLVRTAARRRGARRTSAVLNLAPRATGLALLPARPTAGGRGADRVHQAGRAGGRLLPAAPRRSARPPDQPSAGLEGSAQVGQGGQRERPGRRRRRPRRGPRRRSVPALSLDVGRVWKRDPHGCARSSRGHGACRRGKPARAEARPPGGRSGALAGGRFAVRRRGPRRPRGARHPGRQKARRAPACPGMLASAAHWENGRQRLVKRGRAAAVAMASIASTRMR